MIEALAYVVIALAGVLLFLGFLAFRDPDNIALELSAPK